jgi:hypothetical protein
MMRILFTSACKPLPVFLNRFLSIDDLSYRFVVDQGPFSASSDVPCFSLHFLAQNVSVPSLVLEWPTYDELRQELEAEFHDYVAITFKVIDLHVVEKMIGVIRSVSPRTKVILGGYGTLALNEPEFQSLRDSADLICAAGDGVRFLRRILNEATDRPVRAHLPVETIKIPWLEELGPLAVQIGYSLSALGCPWRCEFCCSSAYSDGQTIEVMSPEEIVDSMKYYYRKYARIRHVVAMDEELLLRKQKVEAIGKLIREDSEFGLATLSMVGFGTIKALSRWEPEELLLNGVGEFWTGVESKYSYSRKKGPIDDKALIHSMMEHGIEAQVSWIMGDDCQTKENIEEDIQDLMKFNACTFQLTTISAFPGTPLYKRVKAEGRVPPIKPEEFHLFGNTMHSLHFTHEERLNLIFSTYERLYAEQGPSMMKALDVCMNGYEYCSRSKNPFLYGPKRQYFKKRIDYSIFLNRVAIEFAPSEKVKKSMEDLLRRYVSLFGPLRKSQQFLADKALKLAEKEMARRGREGYSTLRNVPLGRFEYNIPAPILAAQQ